MRILVEVSWGMGNMVQGTPLCHALSVLNHEVDLFIHNRGLARTLAPLFRGWSEIGQVFTSARDIPFEQYDLGVCCYGERRTSKRLPPGFCFEFGEHNRHGRNESDLNLSAAVRLGYRGPKPPSHVQCSDRDFALQPGTAVIHAGCDPKNVVKRWAHWPEICKRLEAGGTSVVIVGTDADRSPDNWEGSWRCEFNLPINDLAALIGQATIYLGNDSGVGHIAAALGLPGVLLFGPSDPVKNAPNSSVLTTLVAPAKQGESRRPGEQNAVPIERIHLEDVWRQVTKVLADPSRDPPRELTAGKMHEPSVSSQPTWPDTPDIKELEDYLQQLVAWNASRLVGGTARRDLVRAGKALARQVHLELARAYLGSTSPTSSRQAKYHAQMAVRAGSLIRGRIARLRTRRTHG